MTTPKNKPTLSLADRQMMRIAARCVDLEARKYSFEATVFARMKPQYQNGTDGDTIHLRLVAKKYARLKKIAKRLRELAEGKSPNANGAG